MCEAINNLGNYGACIFEVEEILSGGSLLGHVANERALLPAEEIYSNKWTRSLSADHQSFSCLPIGEDAQTKIPLYSTKAYVKALKEQLQSNPDLELRGTVVAFPVNNRTVAIVDLGGGFTAALRLQNFCRARVPNINLLVSIGQKLDGLFLESYNDDRYYLRKIMPTPIEEADRLGIVEGGIYPAMVGMGTNYNSRFALLSQDLVGLLDNCEQLKSVNIGDIVFVRVTKIKELTQSCGKLRLSFVGIEDPRKNQKEFIVPDVVGLPSDLAQASMMEYTKFLQVVRDETSDDAKYGTITKTRPNAGERCSNYDVVSLYMAAKQTYKTMPNLIGLSVEEAKQRLAAVCAKPTIVFRPAEAAVDIVTSTYPKAGYSVSESTTVTITASCGLLQYQSTIFQGSCRYISNENRHLLPHIIETIDSSAYPKETYDLLRLVGFFKYSNTFQLTFSSEILFNMDSSKTKKILQWQLEKGLVGIHSSDKFKNYIYSPTRLGCRVLYHKFNFRSKNTEFVPEVDIGLVFQACAENQVFLRLYKDGKLDRSHFFELFKKCNGTRHYVQWCENYVLSLDRMVSENVYIEAVRRGDENKSWLLKKVQWIHAYCKREESVRMTLLIVAEDAAHLLEIIEALPSYPQQLRLLFTYDSLSRLDLDDQCPRYFERE